MSCESLYSMRPRSRAEIFDHLPSKARRAASTALSMSALSPSATSASVSPVAGFGVVKVLPDSASTHLPSMKSWYLRGVSDADLADDMAFLPLLNESRGVFSSTGMFPACSYGYFTPVASGRQKAVDSSQ